MDERIFQERKLHLMDIENVIGTARPTAAQVQAFRKTYADLGLVQPGDLVVLACNHGAAQAVIAGWRDARLILRSGPDGADLALLDVIAEERVSERFGEVVICSGDGAFTAAVAKLGGLGLGTIVVARAEALSTELTLAAGSVVVLMADPKPRPGSHHTKVA